MMEDLERFVSEHIDVSRRWFLCSGAAGVAALGSWRFAAAESRRSPEIDAAIAEIEPYFTLQGDFQDVSRGKPKPHQLPDESKEQVGLTRDSWRLQVRSDPENPARLGNPLTTGNGQALDFKTLMKMADRSAVRFPKVMTCLNIGCPLGMGIWEGVPLRDVIWLAEPRENLRRVFYYGYHNDDPKQMFRSSLPVGRVLEDPFDLPPVILCYKLNGEWLSSERGGPVRVVVPEAYGFKSIKWVSDIVLSNLFYANDTYGEKNNDVDSPLKTFAATLSVPARVETGVPFAITGYAQVGISGLRKVQVWLQRDGEKVPAGGRYYSTAPWQDAEILSPPKHWGGGLPDAQIPAQTRGFAEDTKQPQRWPMRLSKVHWATLIDGLEPGEYTLRCRTIDEHDQPQPMPRPFAKSGHAKIEQVAISVRETL